MISRWYNKSFDTFFSMPGVLLLGVECLLICLSKVLKRQLVANKTTNNIWTKNIWSLKPPQKNQTEWCQGSEDIIDVEQCTGCLVFQRHLRACVSTAIFDRVWTKIFIFLFSFSSSIKLVYFVMLALALVKISLDKCFIKLEKSCCKEIILVVSKIYPFLLLIHHLFTIVAK